MINPLMLLHHQNIATFCHNENMNGAIWNFPYTGTVQTITLGRGVYKLEVWGAQGGSYSTSYAVGGNGGYSYGTITLKDKATTLYIYSGGQGTAYTTSTYTSQGGGGFNGGGGAGYRGGGGGGASDIRIGQDSLYARVIVAGGGGGAYAYSTSYKANGGAGGGTNGISGNYYSSSYSGWVGGGGSQTAGGTGGTGSSTNYYGQAGTFGIGGNTGYKYNSTSYYSAGAGGGGWYGGGAAGNYSSSSRNRACGGGGGSGYIYAESTATNYPSGCLLTSKYYLTDAATIAGNTSFISPTGTTETGHTGNGYCRITCISGKGEAKPEFVDYIESNGTQYIDTGVSIDPSIGGTLKYVIDSQMLPSTAGCLNGSGYGASPYFNSFYVGFFQGTMYYGNGRTDVQVSDVPQDYERHIFTYDAKNGIASISNVYTANFTYQAPDAALPLCLFGYSQATANPLHSERMYSCKIYQNDILIRDFVPALQNGVYGLWDKKNKKFYSSATSSQFTGFKSVTLPSGYTQVLYIESSGSSYIDTEFKPNNNTRIISDFQAVGWAQSDVCMFTGVNSTPMFMFGKESSADWRTGIYYNSSNVVHTNNIQNDWSGRNILDWNKNTVTWRGITNTISNYPTFQCLHPAYIFATYDGASAKYLTKGRLYSYKIYDNNILIRDYIPCINSSGVYGLYDLVNKKFISSASGTQFTGG